MEQRQDYLESQIDIIAKALKKILEKLLKLKSSDISSPEIKSIMASQISEKAEDITIDSLEFIKGSDLVKILVEQFDYTETSLRKLADILFELSSKVETKQYLKQKALILYQHFLLDKKNNLDFLIFSRIKELENNLKKDDV